MAKQSRAEYQGTQNFHHKADIVVIYRLTDDVLYLETIGNHSNLKLTRSKN
jgi:mRNA-degrading endonuclease YafQ of YafQ-DinJ toxin-antitoxin module